MERVDSTISMNSLPSEDDLFHYSDEIPADSVPIDHSDGRFSNDEVTPNDTPNFVKRFFNMDLSDTDCLTPSQSFESLSDEPLMQLTDENISVSESVSDTVFEK